MVRSALCSLFFLLAAILPTQAQLLWEISGNSLEKKSYLFGTIHLANEKVMSIKPTLVSTIDNVDEFALELAMEDINMMDFMAALVLPDSVEYADFLSEDQEKMLDSILVAKTGLPVVYLKRMMPTILFSLMMDKDKTMDKGYMPMDYILQQEAVAMDKSVKSLESMETQLGVLSSIPLEDQFNELIDFLEGQNDGELAVLEEIEELSKIYVKQDIDSMQAYIANDPSMSKSAISFMLDERNHAMCQTILATIHFKSLFIAVGAGHLGGEKGMVNILRQSGYELKPIKLNFED